MLLSLGMMIVSRVVQLALRWRLTPLNLSTVINQHLTEVLLNVFHDFLIDVITRSGSCTVLSETTLILVCRRLKLHVPLELGVGWRRISLNITVRRSIIPCTTHLVTIVHLVTLRGMLIRGIIVKVLLLLMLLLLWLVPLRHFIS